MALSSHHEFPAPLWRDEQGTIRIADTRVSLDVIIAAYQHGDTPNEINRGFPTLKLSEIYAALAYYLSNPERVHDYLRERDEQSDLISLEMDVSRSNLTERRVSLVKRIMH